MRRARRPRARATTAPGTRLQKEGAVLILACAEPLGERGVAQALEEARLALERSEGHSDARGAWRHTLAHQFAGFRGVARRH